jgi:hypothetical protein
MTFVGQTAVRSKVGVVEEGGLSMPLTATIGTTAPRSGSDIMPTVGLPGRRQAGEARAPRSRRAEPPMGREVSGHVDSQV